MTKAISDYEIYLYFSYLPKFPEADLQWINCDFDNDFGKGVNDESWWVREGVRAWKEAITNQVSTTDKNADHVVLLSAGLDSRTILGGLLENLPSSKVIAATYGIPGAWDFEYAQKITQEIGIRHEVFNLLDEKWDVDQLALAATRLSRPVSVHQSYIRQKINNHFGTDCVYWSGAFGDAIGGWGLPEVPNIDKRVAVEGYVDIEPTPHYKNQTFRSGLIDKILAEFPWGQMNQDKFSLDQQLIFSLKEKFLLFPILLVKGFVFKTPFLDKRWVDFMSNVPYKWLLDRYLYKKIAQECYQELSNLPSETAAGAPFYASHREVLMRKAIAKIKPYIIKRDPYRSHPRTNYINWTESLRHKGSFQETIYTTLQDLKKRSIIEAENIDTWWQDHLNRKVDYTTLLMNLSSLELLLKVGLI